MFSDAGGGNLSFSSRFFGICRLACKLDCAVLSNDVMANGLLLAIAIESGNGSFFGSATAGFANNRDTKNNLIVDALNIWGTIIFFDFTPIKPYVG